jgi:hypothetical protein
VLHSLHTHLGSGSPEEADAALAALGALASCHAPSLAAYGGYLSNILDYLEAFSDGQLKKVGGRGPGLAPGWMAAWSWYWRVHGGIANSLHPSMCADIEGSTASEPKQHGHGRCMSQRPRAPVQVFTIFAQLTGPEGQPAAAQQAGTQPAAQAAAGSSSGGAGGSGSSSSGRRQAGGRLDDELHITINKAVAHSSASYKRIGIIGTMALLRQLGATYVQVGQAAAAAAAAAGVTLCAVLRTPGLTHLVPIQAHYFAADGPSAACVDTCTQSSMPLLYTARQAC